MADYVGGIPDFPPVLGDYPSPTQDERSLLSPLPAVAQPERHSRKKVVAPHLPALLLLSLQQLTLHAPHRRVAALATEREPSYLKVPFVQ